MLTLVVFLILLSILVLVHEWGHFMAGKLAGVGVEEFALGLPFTKPLWNKKTRGGMKVSFYPVLFGGFVRLLGEENENKANKTIKSIKGKYFYRIGVGRRMAITVAGVAMNAFLAVVAFYFFLNLAGFKVLIPKIVDYNFRSPARGAIVITGVQKDSPAERAAIKGGEVVTSVDGREFVSLSDFQKYIRARAGEEIILHLADATLADDRTVRVTPRKIPPAGEGPLGVGIAEATILEYSSSSKKTSSGLLYAADMFGYNLRVIAHLAGRSVEDRNIEPLSESVSGPVGIAGAVDTIINLGGGRAAVQLINLLGLLSLSLAFMNILPFPALDGGRLVFLLFEAATGRKIAAQYETRINQIGMTLLLGLIILISVSDLRKMFER
jgi:regulator of sigma E protease